MNGTLNGDETFVSTREALITVLPQASKEDIENYDEQLSKVDLFDPVLIISANQNWINQNTYAAYQQPPQEPIGTAWILNNVAVRKSDFAEDDRFFCS
ncbi:hypothetical protein GLOIN_2v1779675 [Rhizophagus clarus]|uniref:Uncharacterized protein n=1 Tax=Rhizophagus clarus TaxID=94130 RepID=A0A8H3M5N5_9GLOM|nr:hypothetical protein GLOIN_2v1779675 [Rhizophagus clarus]